MTALVVIPAGADPVTPFRCVKFACTLTFKACLRRQAERFQRNGSSGEGKRWKLDRPQFPFCADECEDGRAIAAHFGKVETTVVSLGASGLATRYEPQPPRLAEAPKEEPMPKKPAATPLDPKENAAMTGKSCKCGCGRALRVNNRSGYSGYCNAKRYGAGDRAPRKTTRLPTQSAAGARILALDTDELLRRREELLAEVAEIERTLQVRLAAEEGRLEKLRAVVARAGSPAPEAIPA